jgi:hypothetical protein
MGEIEDRLSTLSQKYNLVKDNMKMYGFVSIMIIIIGVALCSEHDLCTIPFVFVSIPILMIVVNYIKLRSVIREIRKIIDDMTTFLLKMKSERENVNNS